MGLGQAFDQLFQFEDHDVLENVRWQGEKGHHRHAGQKRGFEVVAQNGPNGAADRLQGRLFVTGAKLGDHVRGQVTGQKEHGVLEVNNPALTVGQHPLVEHLVEQVHYLQVPLFDLVDQNHRVGALAHGLGEHAALAVPDVTRGRPDQPADRVLFLEFAHVDGYREVITAEQQIGNRQPGFGFAHAAGADQQKDPQGLAWVLDPGLGGFDHLGNHAQGPILSLDALFEVFLQPDDVERLVPHDIAERDTGPVRNHLGDDVRVHLDFHERRVSL